MQKLLPGNRRRAEQLVEAGLNLGMSEEHARHYANEVLTDELKRGDWWITDGPDSPPINGLY